ncbi:hypothetical protein Angca_001511 [Angiostrongylus cantonensis]|nr:hypothetical protein Angca_001511 [Angiostrongylus cantonensis]
MSTIFTETTMEKDSQGPHGSLIVGTVYIIFPLFLLSVYSIFNLTIRTRSEYRKLQAFCFMFYIGILDCVQLIGHIFGGIITIWPTINTNLPNLNRIIGAITNSGCVGLFPLSLVTALYRLLVIQKLAHPNSRFLLLVKGGMLLSFVYCFTFFICLLSFSGFVYDPKSWSWDYTNSSIMSQLEFIISMPLIFFTFIIYIAISITVYRMKKGLKTIHKTELQMIIHAAILFMVLTSMMTFWHYHELFFPDSRWTTFAINLYWMMYCGLNPLLYLVCSRKIRLSFLQFIGVTSCEKRAAVVTPIIFMKQTPMFVRRQIR